MGVRTIIKTVQIQLKGDNISDKDLIIIRGILEEWLKKEDIPLYISPLDDASQDVAAIVDDSNLVAEIIGLKQQVSNIEKGMRRIDETVKRESVKTGHISTQGCESAIRISDLLKRMEQVEEDNTIIFKSNDVYEVNKRIERFETKIELMISNFLNNRIVRFFGKS